LFHASRSVVSLLPNLSVLLCWLLDLSVVVLVEILFDPDSSSAKPKKERKLLIFSKCSAMVRVIFILALSVSQQPYQATKNEVYSGAILIFVIKENDTFYESKKPCTFLML
jgi:hypothetical protein